MLTKLFIGRKRYKLFVGDKRYFWQIVSPIVDKTLEFLSLPAKFLSKKVQDLKQYMIYGKSHQSNLPEGYTQLEYIESTTDQYINTGIKGELESELTFIGQRTGDNLNQNYGHLWGDLSNSAKAISFNTPKNASSSCSSRFGDKVTSSSTSPIKFIPLNTHVTIVQNKEKATASTGYEVAFNTTTEFETDNPIFLFTAALSGGGPTASSHKWRCEYFSHTKGGVLVQEFIPCKNAQGEIGMYDTVSGNFFKSETSTPFVAGPEAQPTPTNPIEIKSVGEKQLLPYGYTKLEYLGSNSQAYIDTGIAGGKDTLEIYCKFSYSTFINYGAIYGNYASDNHNGIRCILGAKADTALVSSNTICTTTGNTEITLTKNNIHTFIGNSNEIIVDGITKVVTAKKKGTSNNVNIALFNRSLTNPNTERDIGVRVYEFSIKDNGVLVSNLIPAKRNSDNVLGMYDLVTNTFLTNVGTGSFVAGDVIGQGGYKIPVNVNGTITNIYLSEPLRKIGDYADYIDYENQKVVRNVYKQIDISGRPTMSSGRYLCNAEKDDISAQSQVSIALSNLLQDGSRYTYNEMINVYNYVGMYKNTAGESRIVISKINGTSTVEDVQNALKGIEIYYPLATPTEEALVLPAISLTQGTLTIDIDTQIKPSKITLTGEIDNAN